MQLDDAPMTEEVPQEFADQPAELFERNSRAEPGVWVETTSGSR